MLIKRTIEFEADQDAVWDLITNPNKTKQYMFGCEIVSTWVKGDKVDWVTQDDKGNKLVVVTGRVKKVIPGQQLHFDLFDPNIGYEDIPGNYIDMIYTLEAKATSTLLHMQQGPFTGAENAEKRYKESEAGWDMVIDLMKKAIH